MTLGKIDPELLTLLQSERERQNSSLSLIASENRVSKSVLEVVGSELTNKYAEGYPRRRYYGGCKYHDEIESLAIERAKSLFSAEHANVQPHSGSNANIAAFFALAKYGDTILAMDLDHGGHLTHGSRVNFSGKFFNVVPYGVREDNQEIDYDEVERLAKAHRPRIIIAGASAYTRTIDFKKFSEIAKSVDAAFLVDMAHIAGLIATNNHPSPFPHADIVTSTTHKTLRGPRGGLILCKKEYKKAVDSWIFPGFQGGPLMHEIAGKAVCFHEAAQPEFVEYSKQVIENAKALAQEFLDQEINLVSNGTDNHLILLDLRSKKMTGKFLEAALDEIGIVVNKNKIPFDQESAMVTSGVRIGTPSVTSRGMKIPQMREIAKIICDRIYERQSFESLRKKVLELANSF